ncbi:hypothetical protein LTR22_000127 [Elasticomyces elasticus]|nr:hypothetical protein LTR22_000127 [Elasticomyces elasticus]KAK4922654.1 hypothetical protein LTR49_010010 [Elasticomyces elasticus]KAK5760909.1 hypothetical protein LTS12_008913 [Elasticomyces elasticus]
MSSAFHFAYKNAPKDKPKPHFLQHWAQRLGIEAVTQDSPPKPAIGGNVDKEKVHETQPLVANLKESTSEGQETTKKLPQPQPPGQDAAPPSTRKHLEPRDARALSDQEQARHHHENMDSLPIVGRLVNELNNGISNGQANGDTNSTTNGTANGHTNGDVSSIPEMEVPTKFEELQAKITASVGQLKTVLKAMRDPLPTDTGDGSKVVAPPKDSTKDILEDVLRDLATLGPDRVQNLITVATTGKTHGMLDDRKYYMERLIQAASLLPSDKVGTKLTDGFLTQLWDDLSHPPQTLLSDDYQYRQPDGSKNNYQIPQLGASGMPYARTVSRKEKLPGCLPDPGILFDATMARKDPKGTPHPNKISSMLFYFASIIIHDIFKTDHSNFNISATSSYLDLGPLYGNNWEEQKRMRTFEDGKIRPDCFSEPRLLTFPAGVGAILIMFNRYHNHVVEQLAAINENGRFSEDPRKVTVQRYGEGINKRDDDLFQTGRLITCGLYVNIVLIDYVRTILNLNRTDENWQLNPRVDIPDGPPQGTGNQVSAEFNLVYRWHAAVSERDDKWSQQLFKEISPDITAAEAAQPDKIRSFLMVLAKKEAEFTGQAPPDRQWPALKEEALQRVKDGPLAGTLKDDDLAKILTDSVEDCANAYGPQQVPTVMKAIEILGIQQARTWQVATLNEFRQHFGLKPYEKFEEITDNREVSDALKHLYDTPDNVELYPGLVIEDAKRPMVPGSGLCPGYTVSRGVLSDAVALVRGDRFYTTNYTPASLTNWGYQECSSDISIDNGCVFYKLFQRALPNNYDPASIYTHYPFTVPHGEDGMAEVLERLGKAHKYTDLHDRPEPIRQPAVIYSYDAVSKLLQTADIFATAQTQATQDLLGANIALGATSKQLQTALYPSKWEQSVSAFFTKQTTQLLQQKSYVLAGTRYVDVVRDVGNLVPVHFVAEIFSLPLKTAAFPHGILTERELYTVFAAVATALSGVDQQQTFPLRLQAGDTTALLRQFLQGLVSVVKVGGDIAEWLGNKLDPIASDLKDYGIPMLRKLAQAMKSQELIADILATSATLTTTLGKQFAQVIEYFMSDSSGQRRWPEVQELAAHDSSSTDEQLWRYILEASRLTGSGGGLLRTVNKATTLTDSSALGAKTHNLEAGDEVLVNLRAASLDAAAFHEPDTFFTERKLEAYEPLSPFPTLLQPIAKVALISMFRAVANLESVQPMPVAVGGKTVPSSLKSVVSKEYTAEGELLPEEWAAKRWMTEDWDMEFPFPCSLRVAFTT